ncbi:Phospholipid-transporting ATPase 2 [Nymphaea thermarum]|nr:Phospholipid-transporting ATPase 2 [Nymphaea thermarum]
MAYNVFYTSIPVMVNAMDKDLSVKTVMQHPQILFYCQAGRLLNPSTFPGWFGRSLFHALVVFIISIYVYADDKRGNGRVSGCIWLQAFVVTMETNSFTIFQHIPIWLNLAAFYIINFNCECFSMGRHVHHNVSCLLAAILLVCDACEFSIGSYEDMGGFQFPHMLLNYR